MFQKSDFSREFNDADNNELKKIKITLLPNNGILKLSDIAV